MALSSSTRYQLPSGLKVVFHDLNIEAADVLRMAGIAEDLLCREKPILKASEYFRLWDSLASIINSPDMPLQLANAFSIEVFNAPIFATLCSPNLAIGLQRLSCFKRLIGPILLNVEITNNELHINFDSAIATEPLPDSMIYTEQAFMLKLARMGTRQEITPLRVECPVPPENTDSYRDYFGISPVSSDTNRLVFSLEDAQLPFLTANNDMWQFFEPELRKRLHEVENNTPVSGRVKAALLELLPSGRSSISHVADCMSLSKRTLQRRLSDEDYTYQRVLNETREELARFYLNKSDLSCSEISYLLGFDDPNSFFRGFNQWTGIPPEKLRTESRMPEVFG